MIIGLVGQAGVGKSTLTNQLIEHLNLTAVKYSFADSLRYEIEDAATNGSLWVPPTDDTDVLAGYQEVKADAGILYIKPYTFAVRRLLQWWGTDYRRAQDNMYWVKQWCRGLPYSDHIIVDDVRFSNEGRIIKALGGKVVRLTRDLATHIAPPHASEEMEWFTGYTFELGEGNNASRFWEFINYNG